MRFFIKELFFFCAEKFFLTIIKQSTKIFSSHKRLVFSKELPISSRGNIEIGQKLLKKTNLFGNVLLDVETDNPWRIFPFSEEVEVGIDGFSWLHDLAIINNHSSRELSVAWINLFPLDRLNVNTYSSSSRLIAILRNFSYLKIYSEKITLNKIKLITKNDYFFLNLYKNFSFNILEKLTIYHSLIMSGYVFDFKKIKQMKMIRSMINLLRIYKAKAKLGEIRNPEELSEIFFYLLEIIEIAKTLENNKPSIEVEKLRQLSGFFGSSLRYLQFGNGSLVSAHGGCLGNYNRYVKFLGEITDYERGDKVCDLGFKRLDGARMSVIIDARAPLYGKRDRIAHASFSSFELYYGSRAIFVNCGGGSRFGHEYRKYCQSSKAHNVLLFNEKSQCSFGKKFFSKGTPYYYMKDGPRDTETNFINSITEKIIELSHDAYKKDYGIFVDRRISVDLVKNRVMGQDMVNPDGEPREKLKDTVVCLYFHVHPSIVCRKKKSGVLIEIPGDKKMFFTHKGGDLTMEKSTYIGDFFEPQEITKLVIRNNVEKSESKINWKIEEIID
ncbi:heparinase II/III family protein [Paracoccaceae bacterium]|nr:heparinase II/III family protein [Paracoccaceae bacterium]